MGEWEALFDGLAQDMGNFEERKNQYEENRFAENNLKENSCAEKNLKEISGPKKKECHCLYTIIESISADNTT